jgi:hypothetical protein
MNHSWADVQGSVLNARFIKADDTTVTINRNGQVFDLPLSTLREDSHKLAISPNIAPQAVNLSMAEIAPIIGGSALCVDPLEEKRGQTTLYYEMARSHA